MFQILSTVPQTSVCWALFVRKAGPYEDFRVFRSQSEDRFTFIFMKTKLSIHIMVFGAITSDGNVMLSFVFPYVLRFNKEAYIQYLEEVVLT